MKKTINNLAFIRVQNLLFLALNVKDSDTIFINQMWRQVRNNLITATSEGSTYPNFKFSTNLYDVLQKTDARITELNPTWDFSPNQQRFTEINVDVEHHVAYIQENPHTLYSLEFLLELLVLYIGGIEEDNAINTVNLPEFSEALVQLKPLIVAKFLEQEYEDTFVLKSLPEIEPLDISGLPIYLIQHNNAIVRFGDNFYLRRDLDDSNRT